MRKIFPLILLSILLYTSCRKDPKIEPKVCDTYTELTDQNNLIDISPLNGSSKLLDILKQNPTLQVYRIETDQNFYGMFCHVFYKGLKVFSDDYAVFQDNGIILTTDTIVTNINISLTPSVDYKTAINIAKQNENFNATCISYRLGIFNLNVLSGLHPKNYKLVWLIQGESGYPYVYLDANTGQVYSSFDGMEI
jgi:hypothetical protein